MSKIHLPPTMTEPEQGPVFEYCVSLSDDSLEIDIIDSGFCLHSPDGYFKSPDLPSGPVSAPATLTLYPVKTGTAYLAYYDSKTPSLFFFIIDIQEKCDSGNGDS